MRIDKSPKEHWASHPERGSFMLMKLTAWGMRVLGRRLLSPVLYGIVLYFFVFGRRARHSLWQYQQPLADWSGKPALRPSQRRVFGQFMAFADALLDKPAVGNGRPGIDPTEVAAQASLRHDLRGHRGPLPAGAAPGN
ncbi:glycosyl transferase, partial [Pseudomonas syringae]